MLPLGPDNEEPRSGTIIRRVGGGGIIFEWSGPDWREPVPPLLLNSLLVGLYLDGPAVWFKSREKLGSARPSNVDIRPGELEIASAEKVVEVALTGVVGYC